MRNQKKKLGRDSSVRPPRSTARRLAFPASDVEIGARNSSLSAEPAAEELSDGAGTPTPLRTRPTTVATTNRNATDQLAWWRRTRRGGTATSGALFGFGVWNGGVWSRLCIGEFDARPVCEHDREKMTLRRQGQFFSPNSECAHACLPRRRRRRRRVRNQRMRVGPGTPRS